MTQTALDFVIRFATRSGNFGSNQLSRRPRGPDPGSLD